MEILVFTYIIILGLIFGSFFNVLGIRIPKNETILGRSHCTSCDRQLNGFELIPVFGYLFLKGKCSNCKSRISPIYPIIELITAILFVFSFVILRENMVEYILMVLFISFMMIITVSDIHYKLVPFNILLVFLPFIFVLRILSPIDAWYDGILGALFGFIFLFALAFYGKKRFGKDALGGGDIKLYIIVGLVLGYQLVFLSLFFASFITLIYTFIFKNKNDYIPFVPFIFAGSLITYFYGNAIIELYVGFLF